jgi:hypothetical protein
MKNKEELRTLYAQRFKLPESAIDESILPILLALDDNLEANNRIADKVKGRIFHENNYYYDALSAFWGQAAKFAFPCLAVMVMSVLVYWYITEEREAQEMYQDAEKIIILSEKLRDEKPKIYKEYMLEQAISSYKISSQNVKKE